MREREYLRKRNERNRKWMLVMSETGHSGRQKAGSTTENKPVRVNI